ncbi:medium-chain acyl-CoA ligase ACSF2, mitochondrial isoform X1 [Hyla sarda]|uniref:medium-chain acyl-CoA ligase ACSF2, mitochondrial isoform X1 n=2 Tax=Hyla sarda TaxID=327740 RepID=UPI0024C2B967|nr:medium-chain acyl-CoA ligase ACSF2, mitochondrial isoform X1 [Hyla sarda]
MAPSGLVQILSRKVLSVGVKRMWIRGIHRGSRLLRETPPPRPVTSTSYVHGISDVPLTSRTMQQCLMDTAQRIPDEEAIVVVHSATRKTFSQLSKDVETLAAGLLALGLKKGERVGMWGPNSYEWVLMQYATAQAGLILVSVNPAYQQNEVEYVLRKVGCAALAFPSQFKTQQYYEMVKRICPEIDNSPAGGIKSKALPDLRIAIVLDKKYPGAFQFQEVMDAGSTQFVKQLHDLQKTIFSDDPVNIQFTSGTTGYPKGATLSHHNIVNNAAMVGLRIGFTWKKGVRVALPVPLYHCMGSVLGSLVMAVHGPTLVFPSPSFEARALLQAISQERCTTMYGTPTMFIDLLGQPDYASLSSTLTSGVIAGSIAPPELVKKFATETAMRNILIGYGTTENSPVTFAGFLYDELVRKCDTVGHVMPHTEARVVDTNTGQIVPLNSPGELQIRSYCVMLGYWADEEKTRETFTADKWYKTGDVATMDEYGYCRIVGRCKDMIIRGGENIYPAEIEQFLHTNPKILEAQVVGVKDERMGEEICAAIRIKSNENITAEEIKQFCKGQLLHVCLCEETKYSKCRRTSRALHTEDKQGSVHCGQAGLCTLRTSRALYTEDKQGSVH